MSSAALLSELLLFVVDLSSRGLARSHALGLPPCQNLRSPTPRSDRSGKDAVCFWRIVHALCVCNAFCLVLSVKRYKLRNRQADSLTSALPSDCRRAQMKQCGWRNILAPRPILLPRRLPAMYGATKHLKYEIQILLMIQKTRKNIRSTCQLFRFLSRHMHACRQGNSLGCARICSTS